MSDHVDRLLLRKLWGIEVEGSSLLLKMKCYMRSSVDNLCRIPCCSIDLKLCAFYSRALLEVLLDEKSDQSCDRPKSGLPASKSVSPIKSIRRVHAPIQECCAPAAILHSTYLSIFYLWTEHTDSILFWMSTGPCLRRIKS